MILFGLDPFSGAEIMSSNVRIEQFLDTHKQMEYLFLAFALGKEHMCSK